MFSYFTLKINSNKKLTRTLLTVTPSVLSMNLNLSFIAVDLSVDDD